MMQTDTTLTMDTRRLKTRNGMAFNGKNVAGVTWAAVLYGFEDTQRGTALSTEYLSLD